MTAMTGMTSVTAMHGGGAVCTVRERGWRSLLSTAGGPSRRGGAAAADGAATDAADPRKAQDKDTANEISVLRVSYVIRGPGGPKYIGGFGKFQPTSPTSISTSFGTPFT